MLSNLYASHDCNLHKKQIESIRQHTHDASCCEEASVFDANMFIWKQRQLLKTKSSTKTKRRHRAKRAIRSDS